ncbi:MAG: serine/threonine protein kinase [Deltaproteobacteria bacterium]|nr:serine/threonine protein kinase [Deltaproteobacteria bacterium]
MKMMPFDHLLPETIFGTISEQGFRPTGVLFPLNSYENRVYEVGIETEDVGSRDSVIAKYYRPGRWSKEAIADEHRFVRMLAEAEIPVIRHLTLKKHLPGVETLGRTDSDGVFYAIFQKFRGREHAEVTNDDRRWLGRTLARIHNVGEHFQANHRLHLTPETYGTDSLSFILSQEFLPSDLKQAIETHLFQALKLVAPHFKTGPKSIPLHGDCHPGNILWNREGPHLLDFDDMVIAPPVQDLWMLFNGNEEEKREQRKFFLEGYETFRKFDIDTLILAEPLRTLRMIRYAAWIGQRYGEPIFQSAFPYYRERRYWEEFLQSIKEQIGLLQELDWA